MPKKIKLPSSPPLLSLAAVSLDAIVITVAALVSGPQSVMYFGAFLLVGDLMGHELYLRLPRRSLRSVGPAGNRTPRGLIKDLLSIHHRVPSVYRHLKQARLWAALSRLNYPLLVVSVVLASPIAAALLTSFRPILASIGFRRLLERRNTDAQQDSAAPAPAPSHMTIMRWLLIVLAVIGAALMIFATGSNGADESAGLVSGGKIQWTYLLGIGAALVALVVTALVLFANRWADRTHALTAKTTTAEQHAALKKSWLAIYLEGQALWIALPLVVVLTLALDLFGVIPTASPHIIVFALLVGLLVRTPTQICLRTAYATSTDAALPAIESSLPFVSFVILGSLGLTGVTHWGAMVVGLAATTVGLVFLQIKVDRHKLHFYHHRDLSNL